MNSNREELLFQDGDMNEADALADRTAKISIRIQFYRLAETNSVSVVNNLTTAPK